MQQLGERIRRVVESLVVTENTPGNTREVRVTVSLGAASFPSFDVTDMEDVIRQRDLLLNRIQKRSRVVDVE